MKSLRLTPERYAALQGKNKPLPPAQAPKTPTAGQKQAQRSKFEQSLVARTHQFPGLPACIAEFRFAAPRKWRFDYAWLPFKVALEVEGAIWTQGRHTRGAGVLGDMEKYNHAAILGWKVIRCTPEQLKSGAIFDTLKLALDNSR